MKLDFTEIAVDWDHSHKYSPAPRHRRLLILKLLEKIHFADCLDAGSAQPYLLEEISQRFNVKGYGCDISTQVVAKNRQQFPLHEFICLDLAKECWPNHRQFDVVISAEVLEHIEDWQAAVKNIALMAKQYLLITVPSGKVRTIDRKVGHYRHFQGDELKSEIKKNDFEILIDFKHGFPVHSLYKHLINLIAPNRIYAAFSGGKNYSFTQKLVSEILYRLFFMNYFFKTGNQLFLLAKRKR